MWIDGGLLILFLLGFSTYFGFKISKIQPKGIASSQTLQQKQLFASTISRAPLPPAFTTMASKFL
jgi:hypothetical protein